jgi:hypothetical protein
MIKASKNFIRQKEEGKKGRCTPRGVWVWIGSQWATFPTEIFMLAKVS